MKRISLLFALMVAGLANLIAQTDGGTGPNYNALEKKLQKIEQTIQDPKKGADPKVWLERAKIFQDAAEVNTLLLRSSMSVTELKLLYKEPKEIKKVEVDKAVIDQYVYERVNVNIENNAVKSWQETKMLHPQALQEAFKSYVKASELDNDGKLKKKISDGLKELKGKFEKQALNEYNLKNFDKSYESFRSMVEINENPNVNVADTIIIYYTGLTASEAGKTQDAIKYYQKALDLKYNSPQIYLDVNRAYVALGDSVKGIEYIQKGIERFPENVGLLIEMINYYYLRGQSEKALEYLAKAKNYDPKNKQYYFVEGTLYDKMGEPEKSLASYNKAIELDPKFYDAYYNAAVVYYNMAVKMMEDAVNEKDEKKYVEKKNAAEEQFKKAIPFMEKASEINPKELAPLETLKSLYYRLKMNDKLEAVNKKISEIKG